MSADSEVVIALIACSGAVLMMVSMILLRMTLTRRLKKHLQRVDGYWRSGTLDFGFLNTVIFGWACVIPRIENSENFKRIYAKLDVRHFSNSSEKIFAHSMILGLIVFAVFGIWHASINTT